MAYLESVRYNRKVSLRNVVAGLRVPIELTSLGRVYLAAVTPAEREIFMAHLKARRPDAWATLHKDIEQAIQSVATSGYCAASWQPEVVALSTPLVCSGKVHRYGAYDDGTRGYIALSLFPAFHAYSVNVNHLPAKPA